LETFASFVEHHALFCHAETIAQHKKPRIHGPWNNEEILAGVAVEFEPVFNRIPLRTGILQGILA